ncbi:DMT family transporter [Occallatibacter riparius]|uniref:DMT family transporter n=1 Tax=Occallatibacter riparius TaxID=1002689 RepID=A0A9J7BJ05_9BACT|nr:DMT family transporter [Occallatibacter riparius]UWZ82465.1 DMT family transporter [Occallatibacter riparius]
MDSTMKARAYLLMLFVVAIWGATFVVVKDALADASPAAFNLARMALASIVLGVGYHRYLRGLRSWHIGAGAIVGFCLAMGYQFQTLGLVWTTPSKSAFITGMVVVLVPLFSMIPGLHPPGTRRPRWNAFLGAAVAFAGIALLTAPGISGAKGLAAAIPDFRQINKGDVLSFGCAVGFALHCLALGHLSPKIDFKPLATLQVGWCAVFMAVTLPVMGPPHLHWSERLVSALLITAVLATAAALSIQSWAQSILPSTHTALMLTLEPVFAWITSFLVLGERLGLRPATGAMLILGGIALTELVPQPGHVPSAHEV